MVMIYFKQCRREEGKNKNHHSVCPSHSPVEAMGNRDHVFQTDILYKLVSKVNSKDNFWLFLSVLPGATIRSDLAWLAASNTESKC